MKKILLLMFFLTITLFSSTNKINSKIYGINFITQNYGIIYTEKGNGLIDKDGNLLWKLEKDVEIKYLWDDYFLVTNYLDKIEIVDTKKKLIIKFPENSEIQSSIEYFDIDFKKKRNLVIKIGNKFCVYNENVKKIYDDTANYITPLNDGNFMVDKNSKTYIFNKGAQLIKTFNYSNLIYDEINDIYISDNQKIIDNKGSLLFFDEDIYFYNQCLDGYITGDNSNFYSIKLNKYLKYKISVSNQFCGNRIQNNLVVGDNEILNLDGKQAFNNKEKLKFFLNSPTLIIGETNKDIVLINNKLVELKRISKIKFKNTYYYESTDLNETYLFYTNFIYILETKDKCKIIDSNGMEFDSQKGIYYQSVNGYITNGYILWNSKGEIVFSDNKAVIQTITSFKDSDYTSVVKNNQIGILDKKGNVNWIGNYTKEENGYDTESRLENQSGLN